MKQKDIDKAIRARKALILDRLNSPFRLMEKDARKEDSRRKIKRVK